MMQKSAFNNSKANTSSSARRESSGSESPIHAAQQASGNLAIQRLCNECVEDQQAQHAIVQPKLAISAPDDPDERAADRVANRVMSSSGGERAKAPTITTSNNVHRKHRHATQPARVGNVHKVVASPGVGSPMNHRLRQRIEPTLGADLSSVRIHTDERSQQAASAINAKAFTHGQHIFLAKGQYSDDVALMAHESTHVIQQQGIAQSVPVIHRELNAANEDDWDNIENPEQYNQLLNNSVERSLEVEENIRETGAPTTDDEKEAFAERAKTLVRLNALGMMAAHKATVEGTKERILSPENREQVDSDTNTGDTSPFVELRRAASLVKDLQAALGRLEDYRSGLHIAHSRTLFRRGTIGDGFEDIVDNGAEYITSEQRQPLRESYAIAQRRGTSDFYWNFLYGATQYLERLRQEQIFGVQQAISHVFQTYPFFAELDVEDIVGDEDLQSDQNLWAAIEEAYDELIEDIDEAIVDIGSDDIHAFDLPRAVAVTRESLSPELQTALDEAMKDRDVTNFTIGLGVALAFALLPVLGAIAGTVVAGSVGVAGGAVMFGIHLEDMLDRLSVAEASFDPYDDPLGVVAPSTFEWVLLGVEALLVAFGAFGVWRAVRMNATINPPEELLGRVGEPSGVTTNRASEWPYQHPPEMTSSGGRRIDITRLDPSRRYLWVVDGEGSFIVAPEEQAGFGGGRPVKHGDLVPGPGGESRGSARAGGELFAELDAQGRPTGRWILDNNSSFTFARTDGTMLPASSLDATRELLELYGTDVSRIITRDFVAPHR